MKQSNDMDNSVEKVSTNIDFGKDNIKQLFVKLFIPTLLGMVFGAMLNLADGMFVGRGVGSDALAAVNVAAPIFLIATGTALLFGSGVSVVVAIFLAKGKYKMANINVTQVFFIAILLMAIATIVIVLFPNETIYLFGGEGRIVPLAKDYLLSVSPILILGQILLIGMFVIRLDGAPKFAMAANIVTSILNIFLDWLFVFEFRWGIKGAAVATSISEIVGAGMIIFYFLFMSKKIHLYGVKAVIKNVVFTLKNILEIIKIGMPSFIGEMALTVMLIAGNYSFILRLNEDGVAAYSVCCYLFPLVFMFGNAIAQSALPIISYNYGSGDFLRINKTLKLSVALATACGLLMSFGGVFFSKHLIYLFLLSGSKAWDICINGLPLFSISYVFFTLNIVLIGYLQSVERIKPSIFFMSLRGIIILIPAFIVLPMVVGNSGLWLAVPFSEIITTICLIVCLMLKR